MSAPTPEQIQESLAFVVQQMVRTELTRLEGNFRDTLKAVEERLEKRVVEAQQNPLRSSLKNGGSSGDERQVTIGGSSSAELKKRRASFQDEAETFASDGNATDASDGEQTDTEDVPTHTPTPQKVDANGQVLQKRGTVIRLEAEIEEQDRKRKQRAAEVKELKKQLTEMHMMLQDGSSTSSEKDELIAELTQAKKRWSLESRQLREQLEQRKQDQVFNPNKPRKSVQEDISNLTRQVASFQRLFDARNRFGCWICNQQGDAGGDDSDEDEEEDEKTTELREMREEIEEVKRLIAEEKEAQANGTTRAPLLNGKTNKKEMSGGISFRDRESVWSIENCQDKPSTEAEPHHAKHCEGRPVRGREPTGFVKKEQADMAGGREHGVQFVDEEETEPSSASKPARPVRGRQATGFIKKEDADRGTDRGVQFEDAVDVEESEPGADAPAGPMRQTRTRVATPFISADATSMASGKGASSVEAKQDKQDKSSDNHVMFTDDVDVEEQGPSEGASSAQMRPTRQRVATPFISADATSMASGKGASSVEAKQDKQDNSRDNHVMFTDDVDVEEQGPSEGSSSAQMRPTRQRVATPFISADATSMASGKGASSVEAKQDKQDKSKDHHVMFTGDVDVEEQGPSEGASSAPMRPSRQRVATPFMSDSALSLAAGKVPSQAAQDASEDAEACHVKFSETADVEEQGTESSGTGSLRPTRQRVATPFMSADALSMAGGKGVGSTGPRPSEDAADKGVKFADEAVVEEREVGEDAGASGQLRPARQRVATPFMSADALSMAGGKGGAFAGQMKEPSGDATAVDQAAEDSEVAHVQFAERCSVEEQQVGTGSTDVVFRPTRNRVATPFISADAMNMASGKTQFDTEVEVLPGQESATVSATVSSQAIEKDAPVSVSRQKQFHRSKSELGTAEAPFSGGCLKNFGRQTTVATTTAGPLISSLGDNQQFDKHVKDFAARRGRESRAANAGNVIHDGELESMMAHPDQNLASRRVDQDPGDRDMDLIITSLRSVDFCADMTNEEYEAISTEMDLFQFGDGEEVCTQGDAHGTHFFIVASGEFIVFRDDVEVNTLVPGVAFGESVFLLNGERTATVAASGPSSVYGMEGATLRQVVREHYISKNAKVHDVFETLTTGDSALPMFRGLNGFQNQQLCDHAVFEMYDEGREIITAGQSTDQLIVVVSGSVTSRDASGAKQVLAGSDKILGIDQLLFEESAITVIADSPVEALCFPRAGLVQVFGDNLQKALSRNIILLGLSRNPIFGRLPEDLRDKIASRADIIELEPGEELQAPPTLRFVICLQGEVSARPKDEISSPRIDKLKGTPSVDCFGDKYVINHTTKWDHRIRASQDGAKVALLAARALRELQKFDDLDKSIEHDEKVRIITGVFVFQNLPASQVDLLVSTFQVKHYTAGETIFSQGEPGDKFYVIRDGMVSIQKDGKSVRTLTKHDYFGERALLYDEPRTATIVADEKTECWFVMKKVFVQVLDGPILQYLEERIRLQDTRIVFRDLKTVGILGRGGFGVVKLCTHKKSGTKYAMKCLNRKRVVEQNSQEILLSELMVLREVDHPFIIKLVRSFKDDHTLYFLTEVVSGGELLDALDHIGLLNVEQTQFYAGSLILVLEYLHDRRIVYLDLKSENVLVDQQGFLKLIDFGAAKRTKGVRIHALEGTPVFMAPEVILGKGYTCSADLWSLGVCVYEFMVGEFPFANHCKNQHEIFAQVLKAPLKFPSWFDAEHGKSLISGLLTRDPSQRLGATFEGYHGLKDHPFFDGFVWEALLGRQLKPPYLPTRTTEDTIVDNKKGLTKSASMEFAEDIDVDQDWRDPNPDWAADF